MASIFVNSYIFVTLLCLDTIELNHYSYIGYLWINRKSGLSCNSPLNFKFSTR